MKKQLITAGIISAIGLVGAVGVTSVSAMNDEARGNKAEATSQLAERFNLDENEVKTFFEERRASRQTKHETQRAERLAEAVKDGTLTQAQADLIKEKSIENKAEREASKDSDLTREERQGQRTEHRTEMQSWAKENGIPESFMNQGQGRGGHGHGSRGMNQQ